MHFSGRESLLGWHGSSIKNRKKDWTTVPLCLFWTIWKEKNMRAFENIEKGDQAIKQSFVYVFCGWVRVYIGDSSLLLDFIDWLSSRWGGRVVFCSSLSFGFFLRILLGTSSIFSLAIQKWSLQDELSC